MLVNINLSSWPCKIIIILTCTNIEISTLYYQHQILKLVEFDFVVEARVKSFCLTDFFFTLQALILELDDNYFSSSILINECSM